MRFVSNCRVGENRRLLDCELQCEELNDAETQNVEEDAERRIYVWLW